MTVTRPLFKTTAGLWTAVFVSLIIHLMLFFSLPSTKTENLSLGQEHFSTLIVVANTDISTVQKSTTKHTKTTSIPAIPSTSKIAQTKKHIKKASQTNLPTPPSQQNKTDSMNSVRGNIQSRLSQYLSYPELARRKNWQGIVIISLVVNDSGNFQDVQINSSSGFTLLDNTALSAVQQLGAVEIAEEFKLALNVTIEIPIQFKLQGT